MATELSRETAVTLSIGTILAVGGAVVGGALWVQGMINDVEASKTRIDTLSARIAALEADTGSDLPRIAAVEQAIEVSRCRENEVKDILDGVISTVDQLTVIIETGGAQAARARAGPQLQSLLRRLENWKCS